MSNEQWEMVTFLANSLFEKILRLIVWNSSLTRLFPGAIVMPAYAQWKSVHRPPFGLQIVRRRDCRSGHFLFGRARRDLWAARSKWSGENHAPPTDYGYYPSGCRLYRSLWATPRRE